MPNTHQTLQDIADILSFESDKTLLKKRLESDTMDWDHLVREVVIWYYQPFTAD